MELSCEFSGVITGKTLSTHWHGVDTMSSWIPYILGDMGLEFLLSSLGNHPKQQGEKKSKLASSWWIRSTDTLNHLALAPGPWILPSLCVTHPTVIRVLWLLLICHVLLLRDISHHAALIIITSPWDDRDWMQNTTCLDNVPCLNVSHKILPSSFSWKGIEVFLFFVLMNCNRF